MHVAANDRNSESSPHLGGPVFYLPFEAVVPFRSFLMHSVITVHTGQYDGRVSFHKQVDPIICLVVAPPIRKPPAISKCEEVHLRTLNCSFPRPTSGPTPVLSSSQVVIIDNNNKTGIDIMDIGHVQYLGLKWRTHGECVFLSSRSCP